MNVAQIEVKKVHGRPLSQEARRRLFAHQWPRPCGVCGIEHDAKAWLKLPLLGVQNDAFADHELRNCKCGSTLMAIVEIHDLGAE